MAFGNFAAGFASTFSPTAVGGAINQGYADYKKGQAIDTADKAYKQGMDQLDMQAGKAPKGTTFEKQPTLEVGGKAVPVQGDSPISTEGVKGAIVDPSSQSTLSNDQYAAKKAALEADKREAYTKANIQYYTTRGMDKERIAAEKDLENQQFARGFQTFHQQVVDGDPEAMGKAVGYMNATMGNGQRIEMNKDGTMSLYQGDQVIQANFKPSRAQIDGAVVSMYNAAKFYRDGDIDGYISRLGAIQKQALDLRGANREDEKLVQEKRNAEALKTYRDALITNKKETLAETVRSNKVKEAQAQAEGESKAALRTAQAGYYDSVAKGKAPKGITYAVDPNTGRNMIVDANGRHLGYQDPQTGDDILFGYSPQTVSSNRKFAEKNGLAYGSVVVPDADGNPVPKYLFDMGNGQYAETAAEAQKIIDARNKPKETPKAQPKEAKRPQNVSNVASTKKQVLDQSPGAVRARESARKTVEAIKGAKRAKEATKHFRYDNVKDM